MRTGSLLATPWLILLLACGSTTTGGPGPTPPSSAACVDIQAVTPFPQTFAGPSPFFNAGPLQFQNPSTGAAAITPVTIEDRPEDKDGKPELYVSHSAVGGTGNPLVLNFPGASFPQGVGEVWVKLQHFNRAQLTAYGFGASIANAGQPKQKVKAFLHLAGGRPINRVVIEGAEILLYEVCWTP